MDKFVWTTLFATLVIMAGVILYVSSLIGQFDGEAPEFTCNPSSTYTLKECGN